MSGIFAKVHAKAFDSPSIGFYLLDEIVETRNTLKYGWLNLLGVELIIYNLYLSKRSLW